MVNSSSVSQLLPLIFPIYNCLDPYLEYGSGSTKVLNTDSIGIRIRNTAQYSVFSWNLKPSAVDLKSVFSRDLDRMESTVPRYVCVQAELPPAHLWASIPHLHQGPLTLSQLHGRRTGTVGTGTFLIKFCLFALLYAYFDNPTKKTNLNSSFLFC